MDIMHFEVKNKEYQLNFGVRFVAELDKVEKIKDSSGIEFGMGTIVVKEKLEMRSFEALANVIRCAIYDRKFSQDDILAELENHTDWMGLFEEIESEIKNSQAVQVVEKKMDALDNEANRKKAVKKHMKK